MLFEAVLEKEKFQHLEQEQLISFQPSRGAPAQWGGEAIANHSFWWEPYLPSYDEKKVIRNYAGRLNFLQRSEELHPKPDLLLLNGEYKTLPFPAMSPGRVYLAEPFSLILWERFKNLAVDIQWLIECKDYEPGEQDLVRFIWYAASYQVPSLLVIQGSFPPWLRGKFNQDVLALNQSGVRTEMIENFDVGERNYCLSKLSSLV